MSKQLDATGMRKLAKKIQKLIPGLGFALVTFEFNEPGMGNYISNAQRPDMIKSLKETVERLEKGQDFPTPDNN